MVTALYRHMCLVTVYLLERFVGLRVRQPVFTSPVLQTGTHHQLPLFHLYFGQMKNIHTHTRGAYMRIMLATKATSADAIPADPYALESEDPPDGVGGSSISDAAATTVLAVTFAL